MSLRSRRKLRHGSVLPQKISLPMNHVFENLFKLDPILSGFTPSLVPPPSPSPSHLSLQQQPHQIMVPISEELQSIQGLETEEADGLDQSAGYYFSRSNGNINNISHNSRIGMPLVGGSMGRRRDRTGLDLFYNRYLQDVQQPQEHESLDCNYSYNKGGTEGRNLFKKNGLGKTGRLGCGTSTLPVRGIKALASLPGLVSMSPSLSCECENQDHQSEIPGSRIGAGTQGHFERSGSAKSYAKNRSPLSKLWQMRRRSFSHFELCSEFYEEEIPPIGGTRRGESQDEIDVTCTGTSGFFSLLDESHWESETELRVRNGDSNGPGRGGSGSGSRDGFQFSRTMSDDPGAQRLNSISSDDYGFLRPKVRSKSLVESNSLIFDLDERGGLTQRNRNQPVGSDLEEDEGCEENFNSTASFRRNNVTQEGGFPCGSKRSSNLRRRKAYYRDKRAEGRSRSLTQIHNLDSSLMMSKQQDMDCKSEPGHPNDQNLLVPPPVESQGSQKSPLQRSQRGKTRFFSASTEDTTFTSTTSNMSPAGPNSNSHEHQNPLSSTNNSGVGGPTPAGQANNATTAAKKRSLLSLSSPKYYQRQSRQPSGFISHEGSLKVKNATKQHRWSSLFTTSVKESSKMDGLSDYLDNYEKYGIPRPNALLCDNDDIDSTNSLEDDWRLIVSSWDSLSYRGKQQQSAIWELVESEILYLKTLELLTDLFLACLYNLQSANILNEIDRDKIFSNIPDIYKANKTLWLECIYPIVQKARDTRQPFQPSELHSGFLQIAGICKPYIQYCLDQTVSQEYCRTNDQRNPLFKVYLAWCEARPECNRERLTDILVRPLQRMTKYSLLLGAILKYTDDPEERVCLEEMIISVERFVMSVNAALRNQQESERLQGIMDKIEVYDVVETKDEELELVVKSHSRLNLFEPMPGCGSVKRWLIFESEMRLRDSFSSKIDVRCFLFTDMLLICKTTNRQGDKMKIIRQPYMVDRLISREYNKDPCSFGLVYLNEYGTAIGALALHGRDNKLVKVWLEHIKKATKLFIEAKEKTDESLEFPLTEALIRDLPDPDVGVELEDEENTGLMFLPPQSPRGLSSRASQISSLLHSHSGSIEMNEVSLISSRARSFEQELRGSSLSSEDGNGNEGASGGGNSSGATGGATLSARSLSVETGPLRPPSPRMDRRLFISKSPSPNSLTVQIPVPNLLGQSLPNLNAPPPQPQSLTVPKSTLSPTHRGISYPPPSPRSLRRSQALQSSMNPPLMKSKHIGSPEKSAVSLTPKSGHTVEIKDPIPPSNDASPSLPPENCFSGHIHGHGPPPSPIKAPPSSPSSPRKKQSPVGSPPPGEDSVLILHSNPEAPVVGDQGNWTSVDHVGTNSAIARRLARNDRSDTKRYHTAGAIEDIKKENNKERDSAIQKRLSWNHGPQSQSVQGKLSTDSNRQFFSSESMSSIRSSSGVSSTSSLSHCNSDLETAAELLEERQSLGGSPRSSPSCPTTPRPHPDVLIAVSEPSEDKGKSVDNCLKAAEGLILPPPPLRSGNLTNYQSVSFQNQQPPQSPNQQKEPPKRLLSRNLSESDNFPSEDEEFDSLAYQRATGSMKLRRNKVDPSSVPRINNIKANDSKDVTPPNPQETNGAKKPKDLLNLLLADGSLESSDV